MACPQNRERERGRVPVVEVGKLVSTRTPCTCAVSNRSRHGDDRDAVEQQEARSRGPSAKAQGQGGARAVVS